MNRSLPAYIHYLTRHWHFLVLAFLLGSLIGWSLRFFIPSEFEAKVDLYVAFNGDSIYLTPDDYKNWQLSEFEALILSDAVLQPTLDQLQRGNNKTYPTTTKALKDLLAVRWRNAGQWTLIARGPSPDQSEQIVEVWSDIALHQAREAIGHAENFHKLDLQLRTTANTLGLIREERTSLGIIRHDLQSWLTAIPEGAELLGPQSRRQLQAIISKGISIDPLGLSWLKDIPTAQQSARDYITWTDQTLDLLELEMERLALEEKLVQEAYSELGDLWLAEKDASRGLSAFLLVQPMADSTIDVRALRPSQLTTLSGGISCAIIWILYSFVRIALKG